MVVGSLESKVAVQYVLQFLCGDAMDWKTMLAYITGSVVQELLSRNELFPASEKTNRVEGPVRCRERLGGLLRYYHREAA